jgi:hypothetical protein
MSTTFQLKDIIDNTTTDKNTVHSYLDLYQPLFEKKKETAKNVLEIGICNGGSIKLWRDYFRNATIHALDIMQISEVSSEIKNDSRIKLYTSINAYNDNFFIDNFLNNSTRFDIVLDDGPHTKESMIIFIRNFARILTDDGILVVEDVQDINWIHDLALAVPVELQKYIKVYDLRQIKGRYDDIVFVIDKTIDKTI